MCGGELVAHGPRDPFALSHSKRDSRGTNATSLDGFAEGRIAEAWLAAYATYTAERCGLTPPPWADYPDRIAPDPWFSVDGKGSRLLALRDSPPIFKNRNLFTPRWTCRSTYARGARRSRPNTNEPKTPNANAGFAHDAPPNSRPCGRWFESTVGYPCFRVCFGRATRKDRACSQSSPLRTGQDPSSPRP